MRVAVPSTGDDLSASTSPAFGRCPTYIFVDPQTMEFEAVENPALSAPGGAGVQAAQFVVERGAAAVVAGNVGPNAFRVLQGANVPVYVFHEGTVREAVEAYREAGLTVARAATTTGRTG